MPRTHDQVIEVTKTTRALVELVKEEEEQVFANAYISDMAKVQEMLKRKCGKDPFRIQVWHNPDQTTAS